MKVSEVYQSIQGEGPRVGTQTTFVRFGGCNLRCPGWPCDTPYAIYPKKYRDEWLKQDCDELIKRVPVNVQNVTLTGGEPFIQPNEELEDFVTKLTAQGHLIEAFSNGTIKFPEWATAMICFIMDFKLPGSEEFENMFKGPWYENFMHLSYKDSVKAVVKDENDWALWANQIYPQLSKANSMPTFFVGRVWDSDITDKFLVEEARKLDPDIQLSVQLHKYIWPPDMRGV
ncbi:MAG TPA: 7-carboxy-7-deazaguanine synthase QueE [Candidatus Acidoferrum sp.]|nr:7-carboxy-7-deazaguanine synthase QueE [Candidatus Acidoferrum sp.]